MQPPDELMVDLFLPSLRHLVSRDLRKQGYSQNAISTMLGVTQASVSMYLSSDPGKAFSSLARLAVSKDDAERYANLLTEDLKRAPLDGQKTLDSLWKGLIGRGDACAEHRGRYPFLSGCDICMQEFGKAGTSRPEPISEVQEAVRTLQSSPSFPSIMPEVSVNLAYAPTDSMSSDDVVAVPGRIVRFRNRALAAMRPEFGASRHLALLLLLVRKKQPSVRACINVRYDARMASVLKKLRLKEVVIGGYPIGLKADPTVEALAKRLLEGPGRFDAVVDTGTKGIEPIVYLFRANPKEVVDLALTVSRNYSAR